MTSVTKWFKDGILVSVGFILSPLSWWNDLFVNIPLAYLFALPFSLISRDLFLPAMVLGYWITNVAGFLLMHYGVLDAAGRKKGRKGFGRRELVQDLIASLFYTALVVVLVESGVIRFPSDYFTPDPGG